MNTQPQPKTIHSKVASKDVKVSSRGVGLLSSAPKTPKIGRNPAQNSAGGLSGSPR